MAQRIDGSALVLGCSLVVFSVLLLAIHWRRRPRQGASESPDEAEFLRRQFRRRVQTSAMVGIVGVLLPVGHLFDATWWHLIHALVLLATVGWIVLLALADVAATRHHYYQVQMTDLLDQVRGRPETPHSAAQGGGDDRGAN